MAHGYQDPTEIFIPKSDKYDIPGKGNAFVSFEKLSEDEKAHKVRLSSFELEDADPSEDEAIDNSSEHFTQYLKNKESK